MKTKHVKNTLILEHYGTFYATLYLHCIINVTFKMRIPVKFSAKAHMLSGRDKTRSLWVRNVQQIREVKLWKGIKLNLIKTYVD